MHAEQGESNKRDTAQQVKATDSTRLAVILTQHRKTLLAGPEPTLTRAPHRLQVIHIFFMPHNVLEVFPSLPTTMVCVCEAEGHSPSHRCHAVPPESAIWLGRIPTVPRPVNAPPRERHVARGGGGDVRKRITNMTEETGGRRLSVILEAVEWSGCCHCT